MTEKQKNYIRAKLIEERNKQLIKELCPDANEDSGIYAFLRIDENGFKFAYVGKAKHLLTRLSQHLQGYQQWIDLSIKKHKLFSVDNPYGWDIKILERCRVDMLDLVEPLHIKQWAEKGYQLRNVESGGTTGKTDINERKPSRGYRDGVEHGRKAVIREIAHLFDLHLKAVYKADKPSKNAEKALEKFYQIIQGETQDNADA